MRPEGPRSRPGGRRHQRHCATHRQAAASSTSGHPELRTCRALPSPERSQPGGTAAGRGDPRASLPGMRDEAGPPPPAPRGLCPAACADGGGGGGGREGGGAAARVLSPRRRPRGTGRDRLSISATLAIPIPFSGDQTAAAAVYLDLPPPPPSPLLGSADRRPLLSVYS
jgi:hypothetical protein